MASGSAAGASVMARLYRKRSANARHFLHIESGNHQRESMRSLFAGTFVSLGAVCLGFSAVVFILTFAVNRVDPSQGLGGRIETGLISLVFGVILFGIGFLLRGFGRRSGASVRE
jgi:hypothetical protein